MSKFIEGKFYQKPGYASKIFIIRRTEKYIFFKEWIAGQANPFQSDKGEKKKISNYLGKESISLDICQISSDDLSE